MTVSVRSAALSGIEAVLITVETRVCAGVGYAIVGLAGEAVKESLYRVDSAVSASGLQMPRQKILVSLAPAGVRKDGAAFDLPVALSVLAASRQLEEKTLAGTLCIGELSLNGSLRPVKGALSVAMEARKNGTDRLILPAENAAEAAMVKGLDVFGFHQLADVVDFLRGKLAAQPRVVDARDLFSRDEQLYTADFSDVRGQAQAKRALEIMAAGGHNGLMTGPPGAGKTMLATRLPSILPPMTLREALETTRIYSVSGRLLASGLMTERPFRAPHHTASDIALVGGGSVPLPGEISMAHNGVLFMDELPEFKRRVLEVLRQPLEERQAGISRANGSVTFPANFVLLAAMNPCPCGYAGHPGRKCTCTLQAVRQYTGKLSGPFLDRIDLHIPLGPADMTAPLAENSATVRERVVKARAIQSSRQGEQTCNALMNAAMTREFCRPDATALRVLDQAMIRYKLSARAYDRILKVSRTIADLAGAPAVTLAHLAEAIGLRQPDHFSR